MRPERPGRNDNVIALRMSHKTRRVDRSIASQEERHLDSERKLGLRVVLRVINHHHLVLAYGPVITEVLMDKVADRAGELAMVDPVVSVDCDGVLELRMQDTPPGANDGGIGRRSAWLAALETSLCATAFRINGEDLHVVVCGVALAEDDPGDQTLFGCPTTEILAEREPHAFAGLPPAGRTDWSRDYRADMALAAELFGGVSGDMPVKDTPHRTGLGWRPVRHAQLDDHTLFHDVLPVLYRPTEPIEEARPHLDALERIGLSGAFELAVTLHALDELEQCPGLALCVPLSASSLRDDSHFMRALPPLLRGVPHAARRLVFVVAGSAGFDDIAKTSRAHDALRKLGCTLALGGLGANRIAPLDLMILRPEFVRLDQLLVRHGQTILGDLSPEVLRHLAGLAQAFCKTVIADGIDRSSDAARLCDLGIPWQQGPLFGELSMSRPWKVVPGMGFCVHARRY